MIFVSATRIRVKSFIYLFRFLIANESSVKQLARANGFLGGTELMDKKLTFWTLTLWNDDTSMKSFRNSPAHRKAMQRLPYWCDEASYVHWMQDEFIIPDWKAIHAKMVGEGKTTKVRNPSADQLQKGYPAPKGINCSENLNIKIKIKCRIKLHRKVTAPSAHI